MQIADRNRVIGVSTAYIQVLMSVGQKAVVALLASGVWTRPLVITAKKESGR